MQKLFNAMAATAFVMSGTLVAGVVVLYSNIPSITKHYMSQLQEELGRMVTDKLSVQLDKTMPKLPTSTGPAVPIKSPF